MGAGKRAAPARGERRAALVAAAVDLFSRKPYDDIFISDIAEQAGVAHGLLFYHFKDKRGLYLAALKQVLDETLELQQPRPGETTRQKRLRGVLRRQIEYRRDHVHTTLSTMGTGGQDPDIDELVEQTRRACADFIIDLLELPDPPSRELRVAVRGCLGLVNEMTADWLAHDRDLKLNELERLAYVGVVAVLSTVCASHQGIQHAVDELLEAV
jgi:AcrR family transcriptional regulator